MGESKKRNAKKKERHRKRRAIEKLKLMEPVLISDSDEEKCSSHYSSSPSMPIFSSAVSCNGRSDIEMEGNCYTKEQLDRLLMEEQDMEYERALIDDIRIQESKLQQERENNQSKTENLPLTDSSSPYYSSPSSSSSSSSSLSCSLSLPISLPCSSSSSPNFSFNSALRPDQLEPELLPPELSTKETISIRIRFPDGTQKDRLFQKTTSSEQIFCWVESLFSLPEFASSPFIKKIQSRKDYFLSSLPSHLLSLHYSSFSSLSDSGFSQNTLLHFQPCAPSSSFSHIS